MNDNEIAETLATAAEISRVSMAELEQAMLGDLDKVVAEGLQAADEVEQMEQGWREIADDYDEWHWMDVVEAAYDAEGP